MFILILASHANGIELMETIEIYPIDQMKQQGLDPNTYRDYLVVVPQIGLHDSVLLQKANGLKVIATYIQNDLVRTGMIDFITPQLYIAAMLDAYGYPKINPPVTLEVRALLRKIWRKVAMYER